MNESQKTSPETSAPLPRLGEIGLSNFAPYLMNRLMGRYNANLRHEMTALGLTTPKMRALAVLSVIDSLPMSKLAVYAVVEQSTLSRALDQLVSEGLVRRASDPCDSRVIRVAITEFGRAAFEQLWPHMGRIYVQMFRGVSPQEQSSFVATLQKMLDNMKKHDF